MRTVLPFIVALLGTVPVGADEKSTPTGPTRDQLARTVLLYGKQSNGMLQSTGFVVDAERGWVVTAWHFWSGVSEPLVLLPTLVDGKPEVAPSPYINRFIKRDGHQPTLLWHDASADLALIEAARLPASVKQVAFAVKPADAGDQVLALGNPAARNAMWQIDAGKVIGREFGRWIYPNEQMVAAPAFRFSVKHALTTGFSGGPVFNAKGELAGMTVAAATPDGLTVYAVESAMIERFIARTHAVVALRQNDVKRARRHANLAVGLSVGDPWPYFASAWVGLKWDKPAEVREDAISGAARLAPIRVLHLLKKTAETVGRSVFS